MTLMEDLAKDHHIQASFEWAEASRKVADALAEGEDVRAIQLNRLVVAQCTYRWWREVVSRIDEEGLSGIEAILRTRGEAERSLLRPRGTNRGELFSQAMGQASRQAAQQFLETAQKLVGIVAV
ncbi:hypothetical protein [Herbidospora cretacea]|uniref:hypothetical protein n=1 Tax=Herbidospora cretacea TaxID=28444 RepID=UPI000774429B|nr:hypothetical protein [Herbidospora cretacea]